MKHDFLWRCSSFSDECLKNSIFFKAKINYLANVRKEEVFDRLHLITRLWWHQKLTVLSRIKKTRQRPVQSECLRGSGKNCKELWRKWDGGLGKYGYFYVSSKEGKIQLFLWFEHETYAFGSLSSKPICHEANDFYQFWAKTI